MSKYVTRSENETRSLGRSFAETLKPGDVVALYGELGTGKTRFIQGLCEGLGVNDHVVSPTFTIVNEYRAAIGNVYHFDFYRVNHLDEIRDLGFEEYVNGDGICVIEWAERAQSLLPEHRFDIRLTFGVAEGERMIVIKKPVGVPQ